MATTYNKMLIDVNKPIVDKITTVEDDTARVLDVEFFSNGVAIDLTGQTVRMYAVKPDGKDVFNNGVIRDAESGRVEFELTDQLLAVAGYIAVQFTIFEEERKILSTQIFKIFNTPKLRSDNAIESSNEYGSLVLLFQNVYDTIELIKKVDNTTTEIKDICAKESTSNNILNIVTGIQASASSGLKSIQSGFTDFSGATVDGSIGYKKDITIASVNPQRCIVLVQSSHGLSGGDSSYIIDEPIIFKRLLQNKLVLFSNRDYYANDRTKRQIAWQIIEYY